MTTYNEAENLPIIAERLIALKPLVDVVVTDDTSPDGTGETADSLAASCERFHVIHRPERQGVGPAIRAGIKYGLADDYDFLVLVDADLSHDVDDIWTLVETAQKDEADLVIGSRYVAGGGLDADWGWFRRAESQGGSAYARFMLGTHVRDCTSGFRCYRASILRRIQVETTASAGYFFQIETLARIMDVGGVVVEVPTTYTDRRLGESKISSWIALEALWMTTLVGLGRLFGRPRSGLRSHV